MVFGGIFLLHDMQKQTDLDFAAASLPVLMKQPAAWGSSHNLCINPNLECDALAAAERFVKFLSDQSLDWAAAGQIPVRKSLRESDRFQHRGAYAAGPDVYAAQRAFAQQVPHTAYYPSVMFINEYFSEFDAAVERAVRLSMTPKQSLDLAARRIEAVMRRYGVGDDIASAKPQAEGQP
jgi:multiple sugar transport system substrate-binding protein